MKQSGKRLISLLLVLVLCVWACPLSASAAGDALDLSEVKRLLNEEELHPQRTGYREIDSMLEELLAPYREQDTYTKIKALYDWTVQNVDYSWAGYSQDWAPAYDKFALRYDLTYEEGLPKVYPEDMICRAYHMLTAKTGVCYDWGILFAVMARYVGVESYVHTGILRINAWTGHHGWTELKLGGKLYIFDAQQDNRELKDLFHADPHYHFGIPTPHERWKEADEENAPRDAELLPTTAERLRVVSVSAVGSRSREVEGAGTEPWGSTFTLSGSGGYVTGWYNAKGELLESGPEYTFAPERDMTVYALFAGDRFIDVPGAGWYVSDVLEAADLGLIQGMTAVTFDGSSFVTRAMMAQLLARIDGADTALAEPCPFTDVDQTKWYAGAVNWAYANGVINGVGGTAFEPMSLVTREQAAAMIARYLQGKKIVAPQTDLAENFTDGDRVGRYAYEPMCIAAGTGLMGGYKDGTIRPKAVMSRAESAVISMRLVRLLRQF